MPAYNAASPSLVNAGSQTVVFNNEAVTVGEKGQQVAFRNSDHLAKNYSVEYAFTTSDGVTPADPGVFELDFQHADTDAEKFYVTNTAVSGGLNSNFVGRTEFVGVSTRYARPVVIALANAVRLTLKYCQ